MSAITAGHQPDDRYFDVMAEQARQHWWYRARRALATMLLQGRAAGDGGGLLVDVGCGTGDNLDALRTASGRPCVGTDLSIYALQRVPAGDGGGSIAAMAFGEALPFRDGSADVVTCMDVIEHVDDDVVVLREMLRLLRPGGLLLLTTSSYMWMWSHHDVWAAHRRRYVLPQLEARAREAGFEVVRGSYTNLFLLPPAWLLRRTPLRRLVPTTDDEFGASSPLVDRVMTLLARIERWWIARHRLPAGLSMVLVARRPS